MIALVPRSFDPSTLVPSFSVPTPSAPSGAAQRTQRSKPSPFKAPHLEQGRVRERLPVSTARTLDGRAVRSKPFSTFSRRADRFDRPRAPDPSVGAMRYRRAAPREQLSFASLLGSCLGAGVRAPSGSFSRATLGDRDGQAASDRGPAAHRLGGLRGWTAVSDAIVARSGYRARCGCRPSGPRSGAPDLRARPLGRSRGDG